MRSKQCIKNLVEFNNKSGPSNKEDEDQKELVLKVHMLFMTVED